jgi:hypothetical protein
MHPLANQNSTIHHGGKENKELFFTRKVVETLILLTQIIFSLSLYIHDMKVVRLFYHELKRIEHQNHKYAGLCPHYERNLISMAVGTFMVLQPTQLLFIVFRLDYQKGAP